MLFKLIIRKIDIEHFKYTLKVHVQKILPSLMLKDLSSSWKDSIWYG